jgi:hypothetical protein
MLYLSFSSSQNSSVKMVTGLLAVLLGYSSLRERTFLFTTAFREALGHTQAPVLWLSGLLAEYRAVGT